jgi:hypothetical protein
MVDRQAKSSDSRRLALRLALAVVLASASIELSGVTAAGLAGSSQMPPRRPAMNAFDTSYRQLPPAAMVGRGFHSPRPPLT